MVHRLPRVIDIQDFEALLRDKISQEECDGLGQRVEAREAVTSRGI